MAFETAIYQWEEGRRRVSAAAPEHRAVLDRVTGRIVAELRRRLGGPFTTAELTDLYESGTDWCLDLAISAAPAQPVAWDADVADAAFARYVREAMDFAGGTRLEARREG